jgi:tetratricopeptide (TPR) repeat protein
MSKSKGDWQWLHDEFNISRLAELLGVKRQLIDNWIRGRNDPDFLSTLKLATLVGSIEELERRARVSVDLGPPGSNELFPPPAILSDRNYGYLIRVAEHLKYISRFDDLYAQSSKALADTAGKDRILTARLWFNKAYAELMLGHPLDAVESAHQARKLLPPKKDSTLLADTHWFRGECLRVIGKLSEAYPHLEEANKIYKRLGAVPSFHESGPVWLEWDLGRYFAAYGRYDAALYHFERMEKIARDTWLAEAEVIAAWSRGDIAEMRSQFDQAIASYRYAKDLAGMLGDDFWEAAALWRTAEVYRKRGRFENAISTAETVRKSFESIGNRRMAAKASCLLAACCLLRGELDRASDLYSDSIDIFSGTEDYPMERNVLIGLGLVELAFESRKPDPEYRKPLQAFLQIDANYPNVNDPYLDVYKDLACAEAFRLAGYTERALTRFHDVIRTGNVHGFQLEKAHAYLGVAAAKLLDGRMDRESCIEAHNLYNKVGYTWGQLQALIILALIARQTGEPDTHFLHQAAEFAREGSLVIESKFVAELMAGKSVQKEKYVLPFIQAV